MGFIKAWFGIGDDDDDIQPVIRAYPEKLVDGDTSYRDKYEEQLRNEIEFLRGLLKANKQEVILGTAPEFKPELRNAREAHEDLNVSPSYVPFGSVRHQVEAKLRQRKTTPQG